jgi:hypothetical protein
MRGFRREQALGNRHDRRAGRHQLPHRPVREGQHARHDRHLVRGGERLRVGVGEHRRECGARRGVAPRNEGRERAAERLEPRCRVRHDRLRPAPAHHARDEVRGAHEQRDADRNRKDAEHRRCRARQERGDRGGGADDADGGQGVRGGEHPPRVLEHAGRAAGTAELVRHPTGELELAHGRRGDADGRGRGREDQSQHEQHGGKRHRCLWSSTLVTRRRSTRSTTT